VCSLDNSLQLAVRAARLGAANNLARISTLMSRQCPGKSTFLYAHMDLFKSFIATRRRTVGRAKELGLRAAREFANAGRPLQHALALEAAGFSEEAQELRFRCGAQVDSMRLRWIGTAIPRRLAEQLTPRESEIAQLAAQGSSNRTIAVTLGISERTVQNHCESVLGKLGIHSRWQISTAIAGVLGSLASEEQHE
jgi:DNA-binding CsgD family transcriptional regulator